jgi:ABC-type transport system involved in cytochrome bd biosynthesis fused ATPase/permease subunit
MTASQLQRSHRGRYVGARHTLIEPLDGLSELRSFGAEQHAAAAVTHQLGRFGQSRQQLARMEAGARSVGTLLAELTFLAVVASAAGALGSVHVHLASIDAATLDPELLGQVFRRSVRSSHCTSWP